jgi:hypothetical protein
MVNIQSSIRRCVRVLQAGCINIAGMHGPHVRHTITFLLGTNKDDEFLVDYIGSFPLRDMPCLGDSDKL